MALFKTQFDLTKALMLCRLPSLTDTNTEPLSTMEQLILNHLSCYFNTGKRDAGFVVAYPSQATIALALNSNERSVRRAIQGLKDKGWIHCKKRYNSSDKISFIGESALFDLFEKFNSSNIEDFEVEEEKEELPVMSVAPITTTVQFVTPRSLRITDIVQELAQVGITFSETVTEDNILRRYEEYQASLNSPF